MSHGHMGLSETSAIGPQSDRSFNLFSLSPRSDSSKSHFGGGGTKKKVWRGEGRSTTNFTQEFHNSRALSASERIFKNASQFS